jgi:hypothetical protein
MTKIEDSYRYSIKGAVAICIALVFLFTEVITKQSWLFIGWIVFTGLWAYYMWMENQVKKSPEYMTEMIKIEEWRNGYSGWKPR